MGPLARAFLITCLLCAAAVPATTAQSPPPDDDGPVLGSGADALAWLSSMGMEDVEPTPTADGQLRWESGLPFTDVRVEFVGTLEALTSASLTASTDDDSYIGSVIVLWAQQFDPGSLGFIVDALLRGAFVDELDAEAERPEGTILVSTARDADAPLGEEALSITITISE